MNEKCGVTILIPTYQRHEEFKRLISFIKYRFDLSNINIIVLDGSDREVAQRNRQYCQIPAIEYIMYESDYSVSSRILDGLNRVSTEFVCLLGDDDILNPIGFYECVEFLRNNHDYSVAHGKYMGFSLNNGVSFNKTYLSPSYEQDKLLERLFAYFSSYTAPVLYAVTRTNYLRDAYIALNEVINDTESQNDYVTGEILMSAILLIYGKVKRLDSFYCARRFESKQPGHYITFAKYILDEGFSDRYNKLKRSIMKYIDPKIGEQKISDALDYTFGAFFGQNLTTNEMQARFNNLFK